MNLLNLFPQKDFWLLAVILGMPLLGAFVNGIWGKRLGKPAVRFMALAAVGISFVAAAIAFLTLHQLVDLQPEGEKHAKLTWNVWNWMHATGPRASAAAAPQDVGISVRFGIDALSGVMMLVVTGVGFLIHLYASSYMEKDPGYARFFAYLNLFIFSMLVLILGDNMPLLFVGWEGVGLCSYLLIGFWHTKMPNAAAGKKAFIANRIGDFGLIVAMFLLVYYAGSLDWDGMEHNAAHHFLKAAPQDQLQLWPIGNGSSYIDAHLGPLSLSFLQLGGPYYIHPATAIALMLLLGCTGKSAQIPLYTWLPDAMAGPTPVSALIHAATMVTAGIYLVCRTSFIFVLSPSTMMVVACIGAGTALFAATIALVQNDIKKVLAYSTVSQLGFMFLGVGVGAFTAGFFHVFTHAFFKACLFLGAGSVIHAMHARIHDDDKAQDIRNMGGLRKYMPFTYWTFAASTAAIIGLPFTSGFFSKDEILYKALISHELQPAAGVRSDISGAFWESPAWLGYVLYVVALLAATMTAFYMCRLFFLTFWGNFRGWTLGRPSQVARQEHAVEVAHGDDDDGEEHHAAEDLSTPGHAPHESPWQMTVPLIILAGFAVFAGILNPGFHIFGAHPPMEHWLDPVFEAISPGQKAGETPWVEQKDISEWAAAAGGVLAFAIGTALAYWMYVSQKGEPAKRAAQSAPWLYRALLNKWKVDEIYDATVLAAVDSLAETSAWVDKWIVDGILARVTSLAVSAAGTVLRAFQTGVVHVYGALMVVGLALVGFFFVVPHADVTVTTQRTPTGVQYVLKAAPGMGYSYRWYDDLKAESQKYGDVQELKVAAERLPRVVGLEVINAFGLRGTEWLILPGAGNTPAAVSLMGTEDGNGRR